MSAPSLAVRALQYPNFRIFLAGLAVSLIGTWIQSVAVSWLVYRLTHSEFWQGVATFCSHTPVLLLSPLAGLAADRFPRQKIILLTQTIFLAQATLLATLTFTSRINLPVILCLSVVLGCANAFDIPARQSMMIALTSKEDLLGAISLNSVAFNAARTLGPSLGGILVATAGEGVCFAINAVSFLALLIAISRLRLPPESPRETVQGEGIRDGLRYAMARPVVRNALLLCGLITLTNAPPLVLGPFIADGIFHRGAGGLGILMASFGLGATAGVARLATRTQSRGLRGIAGQAALLFGLTLLVYALSPWYWLTVAAAFGGGFMFFRQNAANNALIQTVIDERYRGRVMSLYTMMAVGMIPIGSFLAGAAASVAGPRVVLATAAVLAIAGGGAFLLHTRLKEESACVV